MRAVLLIVIALPLLGGCSSSGGRCAANMRELCFQIKRWNFEGDTYPPSIASLGMTNDAKLFVSPGSGHVAGAMTNVEDWTDYIYVSGPNEPCMFDVALLICPPENHGGRYGHVCFGSGDIARLPADRIRAAVKEPWGLRRQADWFHEQHFAERIRSQIPGTYRALYGANPQGGANGRQPFSSDTNRTSAAGASRRSR